MSSKQMYDESVNPFMRVYDVIEGNTRYHCPHNCNLPQTFTVAFAGQAYTGDAVWGCICVKCAISLWDGGEAVFPYDAQCDHHGMYSKMVDPREALLAGDPAEFGLTADGRWQILRDAAAHKKSRAAAENRPTTIHDRLRARREKREWEARLDAGEIPF